MAATRAGRSRERERLNCMMDGLGLWDIKVGRWVGRENGEFELCSIRVRGYEWMDGRKGHHEEQQRCYYL